MSNLETPFEKHKIAWHKGRVSLSLTQVPGLTHDTGKTQQDNVLLSYDGAWMKENLSWAQRDNIYRCGAPEGRALGW